MLSSIATSNTFQKVFPFLHKSIVSTRPELSSLRNKRGRSNSKSKSIVGLEWCLVTLEFSATFIVFKGKSKTIDQPQHQEPLPSSSCSTIISSTTAASAASTTESSSLQAQGAAVPTSTLASVESSNKASTAAGAATGALADILDLDFGAVQNNEVNELNRQYILDHQTHRPLRPSVESPTAVQLNHPTLTNLNQSNLPSTLPPSSSSNQVGSTAIPSSNSSTTSSSGSRRNSSLRKQPLQNTTTELQEKSAISSPLSNSSNTGAATTAGTGDSSQAVLRDTKIEIAGKRKKTHKIRKAKKELEIFEMCVMFLFDQSFVYFYSKVVDILLSRAPHWHCVICSFIKSQSRLRRRREKKRSW